MKTYIIEYLERGEVKAEYVRAASSVRAVKALCDKLRRPGRPVTLNVQRIKEVRL